MAQKQPPFKDSVTAHWSTGESAQDVSRIKIMPKTEMFANLLAGVVGERSVHVEDHTVKWVGEYGSENAGISSAQLL